MQELLQFVTNVGQSGTDASQVLTMFASRIRATYGRCGLALLSKTGLQENQCQVTVLIDGNGHLIFGDDHSDHASADLPVYTSSQLQQFLHEQEPRVLRGAPSLVGAVFADRFSDYIDFVFLPLFLPQGVSKWLLLLFDRPMQLQPVDIERILLISTLATNLGVSVENANKLKQANQWIENELKSIARLQKQLLPQNSYDSKSLCIATRFSPCTQVGGDYYDVTKLTSFFSDRESPHKLDDWGFMIADASGHGSAAAVEIAMFDAILRTYPPNIDEGPAGVFNYANRHFFTRTIRGSFITAFASAYIADEHVLSYCNAGHPAPILKRAVKPCELIHLDESVGIPLGVNPEGTWQSATVDMHPGDILILYTDGLTEAVSASGEQFGLARLESIVYDTENDPHILLEKIENALLEHQQGLDQTDDQTLVIVQPLQ